MPKQYTNSITEPCLVKANISVLTFTMLSAEFKFREYMITFQAQYVRVGVFAQYLVLVKKKIVKGLGEVEG